MKFLQVDTLEQARKKLLEAVKDKFTATETIDLKESLGKCLAEDIFSGEAIPNFRRSTVDGYAVIAKDTQGAGESIPVFLSIEEKVSIGSPALHTVKSGECVYVPTGGMIPDGADAMVMVEYTELFDETNAAVYSAVSPGAGIVQIGEDAEKGTLLLPKGTVINAAAIGVLASVGKSQVEVFKPWRLTVISTGDELCAPGNEKERCQVYDINTYAVCALAKEQGLETIKTYVLKDQEVLLENALRESLATSDVVVVSGGSSQGEKDMTEKIIDRIAEPGVWTHGLALKPGKPTIVGMDDPSETLIIGLPGHPVAAMMVFKLLVIWLKQSLFHQKEALPVPAVMASNIPGAAGRALCQMVKLEKRENGYAAIPVFGKSGLMSTLTQADGYVMVESNQEGIKTGETVYVQLL